MEQHRTIIYEKFFLGQTVFKYSDFLPQVWALNSQKNCSTPEWIHSYMEWSYSKLELIHSKWECIHCMSGIPILVFRKVHGFWIFVPEMELYNIKHMLWSFYVWFDFSFLLHPLVYICEVWWYVGMLSVEAWDHVLLLRVGFKYYCVSQPWTPVDHPAISIINLGPVSGPV